MAIRTSYTPGTPSWVDLTTTDQGAAKDFYAGLFGWTYEDNPVGDTMVYSMATVDGHQVGAISPQPQQQREAGMPPIWNTYITVEDADEAVRRAEQLGASRPRTGLRRHGLRPDGRDPGSPGRILRRLGATRESRRRPRQRTRRVHVGRARQPRQRRPRRPSTARCSGGRRRRSRGCRWPYATLENRDGHTIGGVREPMGGEPPFWLVYLGCEDTARSLAARHRARRPEALRPGGHRGRVGRRGHRSAGSGVRAVLGPVRGLTPGGTGGCAARRGERRGRPAADRRTRVILSACG